MGHAINMRATSLGASFLLLGAGVIAALTATISVQLRTPADPPPVTSRLEEQPTPAPPAHPTQPQPPTQFVVPASITPLTAPPADVAPTPTDLLGYTAPPTQPVEISNPFWLHRPQDLDRFYPARAIGRGVEGRATLDCQVSITGALICTLVSETPSGWGFGEAALRIAHEYSMQPAMRAGAPAPGHYRMNVPFTLR